MTNKFKVGDKVVPIKKSVGEPLCKSNAWNRAKLGQGYLYVLKINHLSHFSGVVDYSLSDNMKHSDGDYYMESDLIPYEESFELPEKWCVKVTSENKDVLGKWRSAGFLSPSYGYCLSMRNGAKGWWEPSIIEDYKEITFEQFEKYVLNQKEMEKEIIGYKCPQDLFGGVFPKGTLYITEQGKSNYHPHNNTLDLYCMPKEIVEQWEAVYSDDYKAGDWVITQYSGQHITELAPKVAKLLRYREKLTKDDHIQTGLYDKYCLFEGGFLYSDNGDTVDYIVRRATTEEVKEYLIGVAKGKGFVDGLLLNNVIEPNSTHKGYAGKIGGVDGHAFSYNLSTDTLSCANVDIYKDGKWATIKTQKEVVSVGGKFDVEIRDGKIYHKSDDITTFVKELVNCFRFQASEFGGYDAHVKDVEFSKVGCQQGTKLSDWKKVLDVYNKLQK